jgi:hypothetical protein
MALDRRQRGSIEVLIELGASPNTISSFNKIPPLIFAITRGLTKIALFLLDHGADVHYIGSTRLFNPFDLACERGLPKVLFKILELTENNPLTCCEDHTHHLLYAVSSNSIDTVRVVMSMGIDIQEYGKRAEFRNDLAQMFPPLCALDFLEGLCELGFPMDGITDDGTTLLHKMCDRGTVFGLPLIQQYFQAYCDIIT